MSPLILTKSAVACGIEQGAMDDKASELQAALGLSSKEQALRLLERANGCVETAAEYFYDGGDGGDEGEHDHDVAVVTPSADTSEASPPAAGANKAAGAPVLRDMLKGGGSTPKGSTPTKKGSKRTETRKPAAPHPPSKKTKASSSAAAQAAGAQRSITSFFSGGGGTASMQPGAAGGGGSKQTTLDRPRPSTPTAPAESAKPPHQPADETPITSEKNDSDKGKGKRDPEDAKAGEAEEEGEDDVIELLDLDGEEQEVGEATALRKGLAALPGVVSDGKKEAAADAKVKLQNVETGGVEGSPVNQPCSSFDPIDHACWKAGKPAPYLHLAWASELLCSTTKRLAKADILVNMFRSLLALCPGAVLPAVYLSSNQLSSSFEGVDINVGTATVSAAVQQATGCSSDRLRQLFQKLGDLGDVAQAVKSKQKLLLAPEPLTIQGVFQSIIDMSKLKGQGSGERKKSTMVKMLASCRGIETRFLVRTLVQNIRTGATLTSVLSALAMAAVLHHNHQAGSKPSKAALQAQLVAAQEAVKECYNACPDIGTIVQSLIEGGVEAMKKNCKLRVGMPIKPMLAKICAGVPDMLSKFRPHAFTCEYKYDGQRAQVHLQEDGRVKIYSRHSEDMTDKYPDIAHLMSQLQERSQGQLRDLVVDCELVAVDRTQNNRLLAFQTLSTRGRKDVTREQVTVTVCLFAFDMLYHNGEAWVTKTFRERRAKLMEVVGQHEEAGTLAMATHLDSDDEQEVNAFFQQAFEAGCEGIMCKLLDGEGSQYEPSKRSDAWLKLKRDYVEDLHDTLDLVPIGGWYGQGRKVKFFSPVLLACYDRESEELQSVCRCMSGFSDEFYESMTAFYKTEGNSHTGKPKSYIRTDESPSVWFRPCQVWEIRGAELTVSPVHKAAVGLVDSNKGLSLRFPRFLRVREDKAIEDATSAEQIADMFRMQARRLDMGGNDDEDGV